LIGQETDVLPTFLESQILVKKSLFDHFGPKYDPYQDIDKKKAIF
jgi:hypothetical protein